MDLGQLKSQVLYNCDVSDARHAGLYSVCGLAMRLRDLYKWARQVKPWAEDEASRVLAWIGEKEDLWESLMESEYGDLTINGSTFDPFDTLAINAALKPHNLFYGAGYAHSLKPTFFLSEIQFREVIAGYTVWHLGREHARDLLTLPAFSQNGQVVLRTEAAGMFLWDQIMYMNNSGRRALDFALKSCGLPDSKTESVRLHLADLLAVQQAVYIRHEVGELEESVFDRGTWQQMVADYPHTAVELLIRSLKDLLADTGPQGALTHLIHRQNAVALGFYVAFRNGLFQVLSRRLIGAFDSFLDRADWNLIAEASRDDRSSAIAMTQQIIKIHQTGRQDKNLDWARQAIESTMRRSGLIR